MKLFLKQVGLFVAIGFIPAFAVLLAGYLYFDPFKVLYSYSNYSYSPPAVNQNRDYISTEMFIKNNPKYKYNSFIFGSSRSAAFRPSAWRKYLPSGSSPFSFDAAGETVYGLYTKIRFLDSMHTPINNALILIDRDWSFRMYKNDYGHLFIKHPAVSGESPFIFQKTFFWAYLDNNFLKSYYGYKLTHTYKKWMGAVLLNTTVSFNDTTNEVNYVDIEALAEGDPAKYYGTKKAVFYARKGESTDSVSHIDENFIPMLQGMKEILERNKTDYRVILNPTYDEKKFSASDMKILHDLYGSRLYDFTGKNKFTGSITNFYETSHFRPHVGDSILEIIYRK